MATFTRTKGYPDPTLIDYMCLEGRIVGGVHPEVKVDKTYPASEKMQYFPENEATLDGLHIYHRDTIRGKELRQFAIPYNDFADVMVQCSDTSNASPLFYNRPVAYLRRLGDEWHGLQTIPLYSKLKDQRDYYYRIRQEDRLETRQIRIPRYMVRVCMGHPEQYMIKHDDPVFEEAIKKQEDTKEDAKAKKAEREKQRLKKSIESLEYRMADMKERLATMKPEIAEKMKETIKKLEECKLSEEMALLKIE
jgi:hypothetical protein